MSRTALAPLTPPVLAVPAALLGLLPMWFLIAILTVSVTLTAIQVIVTQIIRLRASTKITSSGHALRLLIVEGPARPTRRSNPPRHR